MTGQVDHSAKVIVAAIFLLFQGVFFSFFISMPSVRAENRTVTFSEGGTLRYRLWSPRTGAGNAPLVMVCHGITSSKELMEGFSYELARHGYRACAPDFPFDKDEKNTPLLIELSRSLMKSAGNPRIAFAGHSLGAVEASDAAYTIPETGATVAFGLYIGGELNLTIRNVLLLTGFFDRFHPPLEMKSAIRSFTDGRVSTAGELYGSFHNGTARMLVISPYSEHASEVIDPVIIGETIQWLDRSFFHKARKAAPLHLWRLTGDFLIYSGIFLLFLYGVPLLSRRLGKYGPVFSSGLIAASSLLVMTDVGDDPLKIVILASLLAAVVTGNSQKTASGDRGQGISAGLVRLFELLAVLWCSLALSVLIFESPKILKSLSILPSLPWYLLLSYFFYPFHSFQASLRHARDYHSPLLMIMAIISIVVGIIEFKKPGKVGSLMAAGAEKLKTMKFTGMKGIKRSQLMLLLLLLPCALFAWWYTVKSAGINLYILGIMGYYAGRYTLVPLGFVVMYYTVKRWVRRRP